MPAAKEQLIAAVRADGRGIDAALVAIGGRRQRMRARVEQCAHREHPPGLVDRIRRARDGEPHAPGELGELDRDLGAAMGAAAAAIARQAPKPIACAAAGPMLARSGAGELHLAAGVELGAPAVIAARCQLPTVARFAGSDLAAGGNGAAIPAWPAWRVFRDRRLSRVVLELDELTHLTFVGSGALAGDVLSFDAGPCGVLLDELADVPGETGGDIDGALLDELSANPYFRDEPPKTTLAGDWGDFYLQRIGMMAEKHRVSRPTLLATVREMIARTTAGAVGRLTERPHQVILAGGRVDEGLIARIRALLSPSSTVTSEKFDIPPRAWRPVCLAMLASARLSGFSAHCPGAGGAMRQAVLGSVSLP